MYVVDQYSEFDHKPMEEVYKVNIIEFMNMLAFMKDKGQYDIEIAREQMAYNGTKFRR